MVEYITVKELVDRCNKALESLIGKDPTKEDGDISTMVKNTIGDILSEAHIGLSVDRCELQVCCYFHNGNDMVDLDIPFGYIHPQYKADKRRCNGVGSKLESLNVVLTRDFPDDFEVCDIQQKVTYDFSKERFDRLVDKQNALIEEYKKNLESMQHYVDAMLLDRYSNETQAQANKYRNDLYDFYGRLK